MVGTLQNAHITSHGPGALCLKEDRLWLKKEKDGRVYQ